MDKHNYKHMHVACVMITEHIRPYGLYIDRDARITIWVRMHVSVIGILNR